MIDEETIRHLLHIVDLKTSLYDKVQNMNRVMTYHNKIEAENGGISMCRISQQEQFDKEIKEQLKVIEDDIRNLVSQNTVKEKGSEGTK